MHWILTCFELFAFITGLCFLKKQTQPFLKHFTLLLGFIIVAELIGKYFKHLNNGYLNNLWYSYFVTPVIFCGFSWLYSNALQLKRRYIVQIVIYFIALCVDHFILKKQEYFFSNFSYSIAVVILVFYIFSYFFQLVKSNAMLHFYKEPLFWISLGQLLFYLPTLPFYFFNNYLKELDVNVYINYLYVTIFLNCFMYVCYSISFLWNKHN